MKTSYRSIKAFIWILPVLFLSSALADGRDSYREGMESFKNQQYQQALVYFQEAERAGFEGPTLAYNLGATHYRLGNYDSAARHFRRLQGDPEWGALAEYNLGMIAERQNNPRAAERHYREALAQADSPKMETMAGRRLQGLAGEKPRATAPGWVGYLSGALGVDDNPALVDDTRLPPGEDDDTFVEVIGSVSGYLQGNRNGGLRLDANFFSRNHDDADQFDVSGVSGGLTLVNTHGAWRLEQGLRLQSYWLDGDQYSLGGSLVLAGERDLGEMTLHLKNDLATIDGGSDFDYVSGWRNRFDAALSRDYGSVEWRFGYRNEYNDRDDLDTGAEFFSYSPIRHALYGKVDFRLAPEWTLRTRVEYRDSNYRDDNEQLDVNNNLIVRERDEQRTRASVSLRYAFAERFSVFGEYRYTDNDANFDRFNYESNQFMVGVDAVFF